MTPSHPYLQIEGDYADCQGGLRWSRSLEAIEHDDGKCLAVTAEVREFLRGFANQRDLIHFNHIVHLLLILASDRPLLAKGLRPLRSAYVACGRRPFHAGAFCAHLCQHVPGAPIRVDIRELVSALASRSRTIHAPDISYRSSGLPTPLPPLGPATFEKRLQLALAPYTAEEIADWLSTGRGPVKESATELIRELPTPQVLGDVLDPVLDDPRLTGARNYLTQLQGALLLPNPRLQVEQIPVGGYVDLANHGPPDRILPSQFALDELEFLRRYADHELLYFQREDPQTVSEREMVLLLDQGVRTWGDVRLVLAAAVVALGKQAARRKLRFCLATTRADLPIVDPLEVEPAELRKLVTASDLTANPGLLLERILEEPSETPRDMVLLTHRRNLREPDVLTAARRAQSPDRLYAMTLDELGNAELVALQHGAPVVLRSFHVSFVRSKPAQQPKEPDPLEPPPPWTGDAEEIGFPFLLGIGGESSSVHFDDTGNWLLLASPNGLLRLQRVDGSYAEMLPRGKLGEGVLDSFREILAVAGGFVVVGEHDGNPGIAHYDLTKRRVRSFALSTLGYSGAFECSYVRKHHSCFVRMGSHSFPQVLDLHEGGPSGSEWDLWNWQEIKIEQAAFEAGHGRNVSVMADQPGLAAPEGTEVLHHAKATGELQLSGSGGLIWPPFTPQVDGRPLLARVKIWSAQLCRDVLALLVEKSGVKDYVLYLFRGPEGALLREYPRVRKFVLGPNGCAVAFVTLKAWRCLSLHDPMIAPTVIPGDRNPRLEKFTLGPRWLCLHFGHMQYQLIDWTGAEIVVRSSFSKPKQDEPFYNTSEIPKHLTQHRHRFVQSSEYERLSALGDRYGQVALFDRFDGRLVCMIGFERNSHGAIWLPDGTYFGSSQLIGRLQSLDAAQRVYEALRKATSAEEPK